MPPGRAPAHRARGFAEHGAIEPARRFAARKLAIQRAELAVVVAEQALEIAIRVARQAHVANLARMRASA